MPTLYWQTWMPPSGGVREVCLKVLLLLLLQLDLQFTIFTKISLFINIEGINIPTNQPITKLKNLEDVVVPTMEIKVIYQ